MGVVQEFVHRRSGDVLILNSNAKKRRIIGLFLLGLSAITGFVWFYWLAPTKRLCSTDWINDHSKQARWKEAQASAHRIGVTHDVGIDIGRNGDEVWAAWIISRIKPGQEIYSCKFGHLGEALEDITCHYPKCEAEVWIAWWQTNQSKSQVDWIKDGFADLGVKLETPLSTNNIIELLKLANPPTNSPIRTNYLGQGIKMNAFKWLRDSGVSYRTALGIWNYDLNNIPAEDRNQITLALVFYADWYGKNWNGPGKLSFASDSRWKIHHEYGRIFDQVKPYADWGIPLIGLVGIILWRRNQPPR
jgi:hypothetical protein